MGPRIQFYEIKNYLILNLFSCLSELSLLPPLWQSLRPTLMPQSTMEVTTVTQDIMVMVDTDQDTMDTPTATALVTTMDVILARGLLMLNLKLMLMPQSTMVDTMDTPVLMDMVCTTVDTMVDTTDTPMPLVTDMPVTLARGPLMPNLRLMLMPLSTMVDTTDTLDTMVMVAVSTVMVATDTDVLDTDGRFSQNLFKLFQNCIHPATKKCFLA